MSIEFINVIETEPRHTDKDERPRVSSLMLSSRHPGALCVLGDLPHNYWFRPTTAADRDKFVKWLAGLEFDQ